LASTANQQRLQALVYLDASFAEMCQRSSVPGVTIRRAGSPFGMVLVSAASTARPVQDMRGLGFARRSTATSCRSASISTSLDDEDRAAGASQDSTVASRRQVSATQTGADDAGAVVPGQTQRLSIRPLQATHIRAALQRRAGAEFQTSASAGGVARPCSGLRTGTSPRYSTRSPSLI
jgi:hypothetical protein